MFSLAGRSLEEGARAMEAMLGARSIDEAINIQSDFARRTYENWVAALGRLGSTLVEVGTESYKPHSALSNGLVGHVPSDEKPTHHWRASSSPRVDALILQQPIDQAGPPKDNTGVAILLKHDCAAQPRTPLTGQGVPSLAPVTAGAFFPLKSPRIAPLTDSNYVILARLRLGAVEHPREFRLARCPDLPGGAPLSRLADSTREIPVFGPSSPGVP
jgi:hypothetical protein